MVTFKVPPLTDEPSEGYITGGWYYGSLSLPNPLIRNSESSIPTVNWSASRANTIRSFRVGNRIDKRGIVSTLTFEADEEKTDEARNFFTTIGNGMYMEYVDHLGDHWIAILLDETFEEHLVRTGRRFTSTWDDYTEDEYKFIYSFTLTIKRWPITITEDLKGT